MVRITKIIAIAIILTFTFLPTTFARPDEGGGAPPPATETVDETETGGEAAEDFEVEDPSAETKIIDDSLEEPAMDAQAVVDLVTRLQNIVWAAAGAFAIAMIIWGGFLFMSAGGSEDRIAKGKKVLTYAIGGLVLIILSYAIVKIFISVFGGQVV